MDVDGVLQCSYRNRKKSHHDAGMDVGKYSAGMNTLNSVLAVANTDNNRNSVYIHIPYCQKICSFCNMRRTVNPLPDDYYKLVIRQIENYGKTEYVKTSEITSVYFGGGTPTILPAKQLAFILQALYKNFNIRKTAEISLESTISELDDEKLCTLFDYGANRLSLGVQTFNNEGRMLLGRIGSGSDAESIIRKAFETGFQNVSIDIIYNYPNETEKTLQEDLQRAFALNIAGFSFYSLIIMDKSKIAHDFNNGKYSACSLQRDALFFSIILDESRKAGYDFLEITKMVRAARDNYEYIRNTHCGGNIFPVGAGAGGFIHNTMYMNPLEKKAFEQAVDNFEHITGMAVTDDYKIVKQFSGQLQEGRITLSLLEDHKIEVIMPLLERLQEENLIQKESASIYTFTDKGFFWGNSVAAEISAVLF